MKYRRRFADAEEKGGGCIAAWQPRPREFGANFEH
jgi:hypothetical protein